MRPDLFPRPIAFGDALARVLAAATSIERTVTVLKDRLADPTADATCETLLVVHEVGGELDRRLASLAEDRRRDLNDRRDAQARLAGARTARLFVILVPLGMAVAGLNVGDGREAYRSTVGQILVVAAILILFVSPALEHRFERRQVAVDVGKNSVFHRLVTTIHSRFGSDQIRNAKSVVPRLWRIHSGFAESAMRCFRKAGRPAFNEGAAAEARLVAGDRRHWRSRCSTRERGILWEANRRDPRRRELDASLRSTAGGRSRPCWWRWGTPICFRGH